jgi:AcrR family transcriptional regulator
MGRRGPRPTKAAAISRAALSLLAERGVRGATMRAIARRAHTTEGNLYRYYPNKRELVGHVLGGCLREFGEHIAHALEGVTEPGERLSLFVRTYLAYAERLPLEGRAMFEAEENGGSSVPPNGNGNGNGDCAKPLPRRVLVEVLEDGMVRGIFPQADAARLASFIIGGLAEAAEGIAPEHTEGLNEPAGAPACEVHGEAEEELVRAVRRLVGTCSTVSS